MSGHHSGGSEVHRLLTGAALAVDGHAGHGFRPAGSQHRCARDIQRLLTGLHDTAPNDIIDDLGIDPGPLRQAVEDLRRKLGRVHPG